MDFHLKNDVLWFKERLCVANITEHKKEVMKEAHNSTFTTYLGNTKMYHDMKAYFGWIRMKRVVANFVDRCLTSQRVKTEH